MEVKDSNEILHQWLWNDCCCCYVMHKRNITKHEKRNKNIKLKRKKIMSFSIIQIVSQLFYYSEFQYKVNISMIKIFNTVTYKNPPTF